jgi:hypothetical protein
MKLFLTPFSSLFFAFASAKLVDEASSAGEQMEP